MENDKSSPINKSKHENWLNSWLSAAKNKSTEVLEFVKKDLEEFGTAVKNEASSVVSSAGSVVEKTLNLESPDSTVNHVKRSFSSFLGQMNTVLNPISPEDEDTEILIVENSETHQLTKLQKALYELQKNTETFLTDPFGASLIQQYECWLEILEPNQISDERIAKLVNNSEILKRQYAKLVPEIVEHQLFWKRYLFKKALLEDEAARQSEKEEHDDHPVLISERKLLVDNNLEKWDNNLELTEAQQIALLEEYEQEQKDKKDATASSSGAGNLNTPPSGSSTDDDWEKISDIIEK